MDWNNRKSNREFNFVMDFLVNLPTREQKSHFGILLFSFQKKRGANKLINKKRSKTTRWNFSFGKIRENAFPPQKKGRRRKKRFVLKHLIFVPKIQIPQFWKGFLLFWQKFIIFCLFFYSWVPSILPVSSIRLSNCNFIEVWKKCFLLLIRPYPLKKKPRLNAFKRINFNGKKFFS